MSNLLERLSWLPSPPEDFGQLVSGSTNFADLRRLAGYSLDESQLRRLYRKILALQTEPENSFALSDITIGIVGNSTTGLIVPALVGTALRYGISLKVVESGFNQVAEEAFSSATAFNDKKLNFILIAIDYHALPLSPCPGNPELAATRVEDCLHYLKTVVEALRNKTNAQIIIQNIARPVETFFGSYEGRLPGTLTWMVSKLNNHIDELVSSDTQVFDVAGLSSSLGLSNWHDPTLWNLGKIPFSPVYLPVYADYFCRIVAAKIGKSKRCLILDLDNTLWGGVIGDDGLEGILIGNGDPTGEAHLHLQRIALELRERGVVLAVSSKNEDATARQPFKEHPDMLLREEHIAVFQANWSDKASNIKAIAEVLSLGLESMVFLDDNPAERMQVRRELPEVAVPELPEDPALYSHTLLAAGYFEAVTFSDEDLRRAAFYQDNAKRVMGISQFSNMDEYLISLDMEILFSPFDAAGRSRIAQLISKSNQFNLTTKRYGESDIKNFECDERFYTRQIRLKDAFGDNGMISVVICKKDSLIWEIDTWLMSCRVLGRRVELTVLQDIIASAKDCGATKLMGIYLPTTRNIIVKDHYEKLGFSMVRREGEMEFWELDIQDYEFKSVPMRCCVQSDVLL